MIMIFFDTHYHHKEGVDFAAEIAVFRAEMAANDKLCMITLGGSLTESIVAQKVANSAENVWFCAGVHPHCAAEFLSQGGDFDELENDPKCCAVGEIGLDYFYDFSDEESQKKVFAYFLERALAKNMPAVIHVRDKDDSVKAYEDAYDLLSVFAAKGGRFELHSYAGNIEFLEKFSNLGAYFSVNGMVTFKKADNIRMNLQKMPLDRLLIETDSPYLAPVPHRGKENRPVLVQFVAQKAADELQMSLADFCELTAKNAEKFFNIEIL
ncbi:MAG: TatD family hydrolase [Lentisphaeria bacterium]|nr:TatD family hydrolase [Lentisphaeria bacterium]